MHFSTILPVSLSLVASVYAQSALPVVSIRVASGPVPAATSAGVAGVAPGAPLASTSVAGAVPPANTAAGVIGAGTGSAAGSVPVWVVKVGSPNNDIVFAPNTITAKPGEMVQFQFYSMNTPSQHHPSTNPGVPQMNANPPVAANAFWSGFMPTNAQGMLTYTVPVRDTNPVWFYCSQAKHCQGGMVGVINPPASSPQTLQAYAAKAATAPENISPNGGNVAAGVPAPASGSGIIGGTPTGGVAQTTKSGTANAVRRGCWELAAAAAVALMLL